MAEQPKKRNIKDLKARLGRTISPGQQAGAAAIVPPPAMGGAPPGAGSVPPPGLPGVGVPRPAGGAPIPAPGFAPPGIGPGVAPPPFARPQSQPPPRRSGDPFAAAAGGAAAGPQEVRLVIDEKPVDDAEVGRRSRGRVLIVMSVGILLGLLLGMGGGSLMNERRRHNDMVRDARSVRSTVEASSRVVDQAKRHLDAAVTAARGGPGKAPSVDHEALQALLALERPMTPEAFHRKRYETFPVESLDQLFNYNANIQQLWLRFEAINARVASEQRRTALAESAAAAQDMATSQTGCVPRLVDEQMVCGLVFVRIPQDTEGPVTTVAVSDRKDFAREFEKTLYAGQDLSEDPTGYVILTHTPSSVGVLGQGATLFAEYQNDLLAIKSLLDSTVEIQGQLMRSLGDPATQEEMFTL